jgi:hypothetical protein
MEALWRNKLVMHVTYKSDIYRNIAKDYGIVLTWKMDPILANPPGKMRWKTLLKKTLGSHWKTTFWKDAVAYKTLRYLSMTYMVAPQTPALWTCSPHSVYETAKASIKCRVLTGTYHLQSIHRKFNQNAVESTCLLCKAEEEYVVHFITSCDEFQAFRDIHLPRLYERLSDWYTNYPALLDPPTTVQPLLLDCTAIISPRDFPDVVANIERISRDYIFAIHCERQKPDKGDATASRLSHGT